MFKSQDNVALNTASLHGSLHGVCHIMNKVSKCGGSAYYIMGQPFLLFICEELTNMAVLWGAQIQSKNKYICCINIDRTIKRSQQKEIFAHLQANQWFHLAFPLNFFLVPAYFSILCSHLQPAAAWVKSHQAGTTPRTIQSVIIRPGSGTPNTHFGFLRMSSSCPTTLDTLPWIILKATSESSIVVVLQIASKLWGSSVPFWQTQS